MEPTPTPPPAPRLDSERLGDALGNKEQRGCSWLSLHSLCPLHILKMPYGFGKIIQTLFWNKTFNPWADEAAEGCGGTQDKQRKGLVFSLVTREQLPADNLLSTVPIEGLDSHPEELRTGRAMGGRRWGGGVGRGRGIPPKTQVIYWWTGDYELNYLRCFNSFHDSNLPQQQESGTVLRKMQPICLLRKTQKVNFRIEY